MNVFADITYLKRGRVMLPEEIDAVEAQYTGTVDGVIGDVSAEFSAILIKRYGLYPDYPACPVALSNRVAAVVIQRLWDTHGASPTNTEKTERINALADDAWKWVREAANSKDGLVELPVSPSNAASAVTAGAPLSYSEQSPYVWADHQACIGTQEDANGRR